MSPKNISLMSKKVIGMVHLLPLPEAPNYGGSVDAIYERAERDAELLIQAGIDGLIVENLGDEPYLIGEPTPAQMAIMAAVTRQLVRMAAVPVGVNVQFNAWQTEIAIAHTCGAAFVRVEVFVDTVVSAQGLVMPCSAQIRRYQQALGAGKVQLWADVQTKYTRNLLAQTLAQSAEDAVNAGADIIIVTGAATGQATPLEAVEEVKSVVKVPVYVGSGTRLDNVHKVLAVADGAIVGSSLKEGGKAANPVSGEAARVFMQAVRGM